jgi:hypothetical protein
MLRKKFGFLQYSFQMYYVEEIAIVVYCSFILHNMAVEEQVHACEDAMESADFTIALRKTTSLKMIYI